MTKQVETGLEVKITNSLNLDRRNLFKFTGVSVAALGKASLFTHPAAAQSTDFRPSAEWDKTFPKSDAVTHQKVEFPNRYGIRVSADLYVPADIDQTAKYAALIVGHPFGGVKEQTSGLYAQMMAERGYIAVAFDSSLTGESGGQPRALASAEMWVEDYSGAIDFLGTQALVDRERIGVIGICGGGGYGLAAAASDPRVRAIATIAMYDIGQDFRPGLSKTLDLPGLHERLQTVARQRWAEVDGAQPLLVGAMPETLPEDAPPILREFYDYYGTPRGQHPRAVHGFVQISSAWMARFWSFDKLAWISPRPVLFVAGETAHSRFFSEQAYDYASEPKELHIVPGAGHVDLYDKVDLIPFKKLDNFFGEHLA